MSTSSKFVPVLRGPTSSGKTSLALKLCKELNGEIISADSRQIYKYMNIGTGKVPVDSDISIETHDEFWVFDSIKVWGYDLVEPGQYFSAFDFKNFAEQKIKDIFALGKLPIVVGGTGFYIDVLTGHISPDPVGPDLVLREELSQLQLEELQEMLKERDPVSFEKVDRNNKVRLVRALEKGSSAQVPVTVSTDAPDWQYLYLGLTGIRELLFTRADTWAGVVWEKGLREETNSLLDKGFGDTPQMQGLVYKTVVSFLNGDMKDTDALQRIKYDLHAYIRRQETWFKKHIPETMLFDISKDGLFETVYNFIVKEAHLNG